MRQILSLNESQLYSIIKEAVAIILESFEVKGPHPLQTTISLDDMTKHASKDRRERFSAIGDLGTPVYSFIVDKEHPNGDEIHTITDKAIILIQNYNTGKVVTVIPAHPAQIYRYWNARNIEPPHNRLFQNIIRNARINRERGIH